MDKGRIQMERIVSMTENYFLCLRILRVVLCYFLGGGQSKIVSLVIPGMPQTKRAGGSVTT